MQMRSSFGAIEHEMEALVSGMEALTEHSAKLDQGLHSRRSEISRLSGIF